MSKLSNCPKDLTFFKQLRIITWGGTREISLFSYFYNKFDADYQK